MSENSATPVSLEVLSRIAAGFETDVSDSADLWSKAEEGWHQFYLACTSNQGECEMPHQFLTAIHSVYEAIEARDVPPNRDDRATRSTKMKVMVDREDLVVIA